MRARFLTVKSKSFLLFSSPYNLLFYFVVTMFVLIGVHIIDFRSLSFQRSSKVWSLIAFLFFLVFSILLGLFLNFRLILRFFLNNFFLFLIRIFASTIILIILHYGLLPPQLLKLVRRKLHYSS